MTNERNAVEELAGAILDGMPVDWDSAESTSPGVDRELLPYLRLVSRIADAHRREVPASAPPLEHWGHLRILERIGAGAFGEVYRAWDTRLDREVALKLLMAEEPPGEGSTVIGEASLLARIRHPNVVAVHGAERIEGRVGLWMEFLRGRSLDEVLRAQGPFSAHEAVLVGLSACRALSAVHRAGLLHRDIKAQNVMREDGGRVVLMDFGTGRTLTDDPAAASADLAGTPLYLAPELFAGGHATVQSDIYSVGVLLFHLVTAAFPVAGATVRDIREAHGQDRRRFLRDERPDLPDDFVAVVERAMAPDPARRFASAGAMDTALARLVTARGDRPPRALRWWVLAPLLTVSVLAATLAVLPRSWRDRILHIRGGPTTPGETPPPAAIGAPGSSVTVRKVPLPDVMLVGRPSPDGRLFSFSDVDGNLSVLDMATGQVRRLTNKEADTEQHALFSSISADGRFVAYTWWALDGHYEMRVIGTDGKEPRVVLRADTVDTPWPVEWSRDGTSILSILVRPDGTNQLALVSTDDAPLRVVAELGSALPQHASVSPDGELIVYDRPQSRADSARDIFMAGADGAAPRALVAHPANDFAPVWTPDGRHVLFASDRSGTMDMWRVAVQGDVAPGEPELVRRDIGRLDVLGLTDQGSYYYQLLVGTVEVYSAEFSPDGHIGTPTALGPSFAGSNISSIWSPDGRYVAYASRRGLVGFDRRSTTLVIRDVQTNDRRELVPDMNTFLVRSWSPDGRSILVQGTDARLRSGLHAVDVETGRATPVIVTDRLSRETSIGRGDWTADGRVLYSRGGRRRALVVRDVQRGSDEVALDFRTEKIEGIVGSGPNGRGFKASPDGRTLAFCAFVSDGGTTVKSLRVKSGNQPSRELLRAGEKEFLVLQDWTADGDAVLVTRREGKNPVGLWQVPVDGDAPRPLGFTMKGLRDVSVHPDGRRITFTAGWPLLEVWVLENFLPDGGHGTAPSNR